MKIISMLNLSIVLGFAFMMIVFGYRFIRGKRISISDMFFEIFLVTSIIFFIQVCIFVLKAVS